MAKKTPKAPAVPADATTQDATAPAPAPDTTEASNADGPATDQAAPEPIADGVAQPEAKAPEVTDAALTQDPPPPLPKRIKLVTPYGFYDAADQLRMWQAGYETDKPDEIELFVTRSVEFEFLE